MPSLPSFGSTLCTRNPHTTCLLNINLRCSLSHRVLLCRSMLKLADRRDATRRIYHALEGLLGPFKEPGVSMRLPGDAVSTRSVGCGVPYLLLYAASPRSPASSLRSARASHHRSQKTTKRIVRRISSRRMSSSSCQRACCALERNQCTLRAARRSAGALPARRVRTVVVEGLVPRVLFCVDEGEVVPQP